MAPQHLHPYERPQHYAGATFEDTYTVYAVHRDSDSITRSNWRVLLRTCGFSAERKADGEIRTNAPNAEDDGTLSDPIVVTRARHWAVGWIDTLRVRFDADPTLIARLDRLIGKLEDYPILDEDDHSELEWSEACAYWEQMSVRDRVEYLQDARLSIFAARRAELPDDPHGRLFERLTAV